MVVGKDVLVDVVRVVLYFVGTSTRMIEVLAPLIIVGIVEVKPDEPCVVVVVLRGIFRMLTTTNDVAKCR